MPEIGRRAEPVLRFNGKNVTKKLARYLHSVTFTDVLSGSSDSISVDLYDVDMIWLTDWYPTKGDRIEGGILFRDWEKKGSLTSKAYGKFVLDSIRFSGGPLKCSFGGLAIPEDRSFKTRERTQTWEYVSLSEIADEIASRYDLKLMYDAEDFFIESIEQTYRTDSDFLYSTVKSYGLKMKVYNFAIVIFDGNTLESMPVVAKLNRKDFEDDDWDYADELEGTYTGATISYKTDEEDGKSSEIRLEVGNTDGDHARVLNINQQCADYWEAECKARAKVNEANEKMTTIKCSLWRHELLYSGQCVKVEGLGRANGKYCIDKVTTTISASGTKQKLEMHKCYRRL